MAICILLVTIAIFGSINYFTWIYDSGKNGNNEVITEDFDSLSITNLYPTQKGYDESELIEEGDARGARGARAVEYWATFQFDYSNTGNSSTKAPETNNTLWKFKVEEKNSEIYSTPIVVNDYVYFTTTTGDTGYLYAVDRKSGEQKWKFNLQKGTYGTPTFSNGYIYVGTGTEMDTSGNHVYRIKADTGTEDTNFRIQILEGAVTGAPVIIDKPGLMEDRLYYGTLKENIVYSYNLGTPQPQPDTYQVSNPGTSSNDGIWSSVAYYNSNPPKLLFTTNSESTGIGIPRGLYCLNAEDIKNELWKFPTTDIGLRFQTYSSPTLFYDPYAMQGKVLFGAGIEYMSKPNEAILYCLDITTGAQLWNFTTIDGGLGYGIVSSPVVAYDKIFFGATNGKLYALDLNGKHLWNFTTDNSINGIYSSPAVADGKIYFGSTDKFFYCLNVHDGSLIWKYNAEDDGQTGEYGVCSSPSIAYNRVFVGAGNGYLYCFGSKGSQPPTISIDKPKNNELVNGTVEISGTADDDIAVTSVQVKIDNGSWINTSITTNTWSHSWNTTEVPDGPHEIFARAFDESGFTKTNRTVIVHNAGGEMFIHLTSHTDGQIVSGITKFQGVARHSLGTILEVQINIDNSTTWLKVNGTTNWFYLWDTTEVEDGEYEIKARAFDGMTNSTPIMITVNVRNYVIDPSTGIYPMFRANQNRIGITGYKVPPEGKVLWKFETENAIESSAIFYNNKIYFGSDDWFIYCLDAKTGILEWKYETANQVRSTPTIANRRLYIGSQDYNFYCLNALSGEFIWKYRTGGEIDSSPLIVGNNVYFGSYDGYLYALNTTTGNVTWKFKTDNEIWGSPAFYDGGIYVGTRNGKMYYVWASNGTVRWNKTTNQLASLHGIYSTPMITGGKLIFGSEDNLVYCYNATSGERLWMFKTSGYVYSSAASSSGKVFISSLEEENDGILYAIPLEDPNGDGLITSTEVIWKFQTHDFDGGSSPTVSVSSGKVVIGSNLGSSGGDGKIFCLDVETGDEYWNYTTGGDIHGTPIIALNHVYIGSLDNYMYCLGEKPSVQNYSEIKIDISIPVTRVLAGHAIENITLTASTQDDEPIAQAWYNFAVTKGYLSAYFGTAFEDGTYTISYIAPEPSKVKDNITVVLSVNATRYPYKIGKNSVNITVEPRSQPSKNDSKNGDDDDDGTGGDDFLNPKNTNIILIIVILLILNIIVFGSFYATWRKTRRLTQPPKAEPRVETIEKSEKVIEKEESKSKPETTPTKTQTSQPSPVPKQSSQAAKPTPPAKLATTKPAAETVEPEKVTDPTVAITDPTPSTQPTTQAAQTAKKD